MAVNAMQQIRKEKLDVLWILRTSQTISTEVEALVVVDSAQISLSLASGASADDASPTLQ